MTLARPPKRRMSTSSSISCLTEPGAEEQPGLEEAVRQQVRDRERVPGRAEPGREHHVADLAHRGPGQRLLDVVLGAADDRAAQQRGRADDGDGQPARPAVRLKIGLDRTIRYTPAVTMVAAWISADTGVGPSIASSSQDCSGSCADLPHAPSSSSSPSAVITPAAGPAHRVEHAGERDRAELREHQHDRQRQPGVADPVGDEGLLGRDRGGRLVLPEPDQQVRGQADALPARVQARGSCRPARAAASPPGTGSCTPKNRRRSGSFAM